MTECHQTILQTALIIGTSISAWRVIWSGYARLYWCPGPGPGRPGFSYATVSPLPWVWLQVNCMHIPLSGGSSKFPLTCLWDISLVHTRNATSSAKSISYMWWHVYANIRPKAEHLYLYQNKRPLRMPVPDVWCIYLYMPLTCASFTKYLIVCGI